MACMSKSAVDRDHPIGRTDRAGVADIVLEAALTAIQDCEDSVAAVDAEDKVAVYRNWLGLMKGDLAATFEKNGKEFERHMAPDRAYLSPGRRAHSPCPGRALAAGAQCRPSDDHRRGR